jgi:hypothetical protein
MAMTAQPPGSPTDPQAMLPPHSIESEQAILGAIILSEKAHYAYVVEEEITAADFYRARHRVTFEALLGLFDRGSEIDVLSVTEELKSVGKLEEAGGEEPTPLRRDRARDSSPAAAARHLLPNSVERLHPRWRPAADR